jgi:hypothetical protein
MAIDITINGGVTLDESGGLQTGGVALPPEDNNDSDISLATLQTDVASFYNRLFGALELNLSDDFATDNGVARSAANYISLSGTGGVVSLGFTDSSGAALPIYGVDLVGAACNLTALDGGAITLFADPASELGNRVVYGVDEDGDIVFALFMEPAANLLSARVWMVQFEAMDNPDDADHDDPLEMTGLGVGAGVSTEFDFNALPSGQNLFGTVGNTSSGLIVFGKTPVLNPDGTYTNASNTINTSQGGGPTTIGVNNQMFDPGDGAYFTYVRNPDPDFLAGATGGLTQGEADDADNIQYDGGTIESSSAFVKIAQIQGNSLATMEIAAFNITGSPQEQDLIAARGTNPVTITAVRVYNAAGTLIEDTDGSPNSAQITVTFGTGPAPGGNGIPLGAVRVSGLDAGYKVEWDTSSPHDQALITGVSGKFDIGGFGVNEATSVIEPLIGVRFEDDGPVVDLELDGDAELVVDETTLPDSASISAADLFSTNTADFGTDGEGTDGSVYELLLGDPNSGLFDTLSGEEVILSVNGDGTLITGSVNGGADEVFTIALNAGTGELTLTQMRAMINGDADDPDEADTPLTLEADTVRIRRTITDGDEDSDSDDVDISAIFKFEDDGPALGPPESDGIELITDDTDIQDSAALTTDFLFPSPVDFGNDGPHPTTPIDYSLRLATENALSGLVDTATGKPVRLVTVGDDIVGYVDENNDGVIGAGETLESIRYSLSVVDSDTEQVDFTQTRAVFHDSALPETVGPNLVFIDQIAIDGDGDESGTVSVDLGAVTFINDDEPTIGPIADGLVDFEANDSVTNTLNGDVGNDPNSAPYVLTSYTTNLTVAGVDLEGVLQNSGTQVTYYADSDGDAVFGSAGDTAYYRLTLSQSDNSGAGSYTFTVLIDPPPSFTPFDFTDLPSGQNLFGCIAADKSNLDGMALFVISKNADVNNPGDGQMTNVSGTVNTSKGGGPVTIGDSNQMYDPGEGAYFVYLSNPDNDMVAGVTGGLTQNTADDADTIGFAGTVEVSTASVEIVQTQGNALATMNIKAFDIDMAPFGAGGVNTDAEARAFAEDPEATDAPVNISAVRVLDSNGVVLESWEDTDLDGDYELLINDATINVTFHATGVTDVFYARVSGVGAGYTIEFDTETDHDMALIEGVAGKYDIGGFNIFQGNDTPDQLLEFTAQVTDGDGDTDGGGTDEDASWKIGIDGTGIFDDNSVSGIII